MSMDKSLSVSASAGVPKVTANLSGPLRVSVSAGYPTVRAELAAPPEDTLDDPPIDWLRFGVQVFRWVGRLGDIPWELLPLSRILTRLRQA